MIVSINNALYGLSEICELSFREDQTDLTRYYFSTGKWDDNPLVHALKKVPNVKVLDLSNHSELDDMTVSIFCENLPNLQKLVLRNLPLCVGAKELCQLLARGVSLEFDQNSLKSVEGEVSEYLDKNMEYYELDELSKIDNIRKILSSSSTTVSASELFKDLVEIKEKVREKAYEAWLTEQRMLAESDKIETTKLLSEWSSGGKYKESQAWINGPKSPIEWPLITYYEHDFRPNVHGMFVAIADLGLWEGVFGKENSEKFTFGDFEFEILSHPIMRHYGDVGYTFYPCLHFMDLIARNGWEEFYKLNG